MHAERYIYIYIYLLENHIQIQQQETKYGSAASILAYASKMLEFIELACCANVPALARLFTVVACVLFDANLMLTAKLVLVL